MRNILVFNLKQVAGSENDLRTIALWTAQVPQKPRLRQFCSTEDFVYQYDLAFGDFLRTCRSISLNGKGSGEHN